MSIARKILIDELIENSHIEKVEDVIFWALEAYCEDRATSGSTVVAFSIKERIKDSEAEGTATLQNFELINFLNNKKDV